MQGSSGLFADYHWRDDSCARAAAFAQALPNTAGALLAPVLTPRAACAHSAADVWMGVDVYGRGTWGGGEMRSYTAVAHALQAGTSSALFAAAWPWVEERGGPAAKEKRNFAFWSSICSVYAFHTFSPAFPGFSCVLRLHSRLSCIWGLDVTPLHITVPGTA